jgi:hypothetical protein
LDDLTRQIVFGLACPAVITGALLAPGAFSRPEASHRDRGHWRVPLAVGLPVVLAFLALYGWPGASDTWRTAAFAPMLGLVAALLATLVPAPWLRAALVVAVAGILTLLIRPYTRPEHWAVRALPAPALVALIGLMQVLASRRRGPSLTIGLAIAAAAGAGLVLFSGFLKLSVPLGALAVSTWVLALYSLRRPDLSLARGVMLIVLPTVFTALFFAYLEVKFRKDPIPPAAFALVACAPLAMWLGELGWVRSRRPWVGVAIRAALVAIICAGGFGLALGTKKQAPKDPYTDLYKDLPKQ